MPLPGWRSLAEFDSASWMPGLWATAVTGERRRLPADTASIKDAALAANTISDELPRCN